jgi:hypothetical protein
MRGISRSASPQRLFLFARSMGVNTPDILNVNLFEKHPIKKNG